MLERHHRWHWIMLFMVRGNFNESKAYVMDDFGNAVAVTYNQVKTSLRAYSG